MLKGEARFLRCRLRVIQKKLKKSGHPPHVLNLGSSTYEFRKLESPFIDRYIFAPLEKSGVSVTHCDLKAGQGVDIVADITTPEGEKTCLSLRANIVLVNNLLEHVTDIEKVTNSIRRLIPKDGHLLITGPYIFPHHPDPIDNGFRPSLEEVQLYFPDFKVTEGIYKYGLASAYGVRPSLSKARQVLASIVTAIIDKTNGQQVDNLILAAWCLHLEPKV